MELWVNVFRDAYAYNAGIAKRRDDRFTAASNMTAYLKYPRIATYIGGDSSASFIMQDLTETVDDIIGDYRRVNEGYC